MKSESRYNSRKQMTMTMIHTKIRSISERPAPTGTSDRSQLPEKESVETVVPCALGKVRNWDTVGDNVQLHKKKERKIHRLLLRQIQMNSDDTWNPQIPEIKYDVNLEQKERKMWQALVLFSPAFAQNLGLAREALYSVLHRCVKNFQITFVCWQSLAKFCTPWHLWQSHEIVDHCFSASSCKSARSPAWECAPSGSRRTSRQ